MVNEELTGRQRVTLTQLAYRNWNVGQTVFLDYGRIKIGRIEKIVHQTNDLYIVVIVSEKRDEVTLLFRGSTGIIGDSDVWVKQWLRTNFPVGSAILTQQHEIPDQLTSASATLNRLMSEYSRAHFWLYGHSLGSINAQYALANCFYPKRLANSYLYEGPNIYWLLTEDQRKRALQIRCQIFNYVDPRDIVTLGYLDYQRVIGLLRVVNSRLVDPLNQHLFGGYQYDQQGEIIVNQGASIDLSQKRAEIDSRLIERTGQLLEKLDRLQERQEINFKKRRQLLERLRQKID